MLSWMFYSIDIPIRRQARPFGQRSRPAKPKGCWPTHAVTAIHYLVQKDVGNVKARRIVPAILRVFGVAPVDGKTIDEALQLPLSDFEDAVTATAARRAGCEYIVTRDPKGFRGSPVRPLTPEGALPLLLR